MGMSHPSCILQEDGVYIIPVVEGIAEDHERVAGFYEAVIVKQGDGIADGAALAGVAFHAWRLQEVRGRGMAHEAERARLGDPCTTCRVCSAPQTRTGIRR